MAFKAYPKIYSLGYSGTEDLLDGYIYITPKVDGSNASIWKGHDGTIAIGKRSSIITYQKFNSPADDYSHAGMFEPLIRWVLEHDWSNLPNGSVLWGEMAQNQNKLRYETKHPFICFDYASFQTISDDVVLQWHDRRATEAICEANQVPVVPLLWEGSGEEWNGNKLEEFAQRDSFLGGSIEEGIVVKRYDSLDRYGHVRFAKIVVEAFREKANKKSLKNSGLTIGDWIADTFLNHARLDKAIQHLKERDEWDDSYMKRNVGKLIGEICRDIHEECYEEIVETAAKRAWKDGSRLIASRIAPMLDELALSDIL